MGVPLVEEALPKGTPLLGHRYESTRGQAGGPNPIELPPPGPASRQPPWLICQLPVPPQGSPHGANKQLGFTKAPGLGAEAVDPNLGTGQSLPQFPQQHTSTPQPQDMCSGLASVPPSSCLR